MGIFKSACEPFSIGLTTYLVTLAHSANNSGDFSRTKDLQDLAFS